MEQELEIKKKKNILILGIAFLIIVLIGSTYAFFTYSKSASAFTLTSGTIKATFAAGTNVVNFENAYPISDTYAISNLDKLTYVDFTISSETSDSSAISYEVYLTEDASNTLSANYVKVYLTDENGNQLKSPQAYSSLTASTYQGSTGKVIINGSNSGTFSKSYRLYTWLDSTYSQNITSQTFSFKVNLYAYNS